MTISISINNHPLHASNILRLLSVSCKNQSKKIKSGLVEIVMVLKTRWSNKIMDQFMHLQPRISLQGLYVLKPT